ncbi:C45 family autoproteolytic acyltransferase/hydolase [Ruminococcus sp.]|uniref:C45 family autoproteolytic acyltransferase/hydolase n=1 Tax=Ruminococcus sp. TaxID=41978 RepID=UPI0025F5E0BD|nr:C45 family autoproteolytic acyltransferase/hydolase [Ruminococcus sp.]
MKKKSMIFVTTWLIITSALLCGCEKNGYSDFIIPEQSESTLMPVDDIYISNNYSGIAPKKEKTLKTVHSSDGICVIDCKESYYDITLDYTIGSYYDVGAAYAEAIKLVREDYPAFCEGYLYENVRAVFNGMNGEYSGVLKRVESFYKSLDEEYRQEIDGFADKMHGNSEGLKEDGVLSRDEVILMQFIPDILRGTACSVLSADGKTTSTGDRISCRVLEWQLGSDNQICTGHSLVHVKNGDKSYVSVTYLGFMTILTAINNDGVMISELDVGSGEKYTSEGKTSYTYALRYSLENFTTAREAADYLTTNSELYPYCFNAFCTDKDYACIAEIYQGDDFGKSVIRDSNTKLNKGLDWKNTDYICAVNSFAADGNKDTLVHNAGNIIRWNRYNKLFADENNISVDRFKELMTCEKTDNEFIRIRGAGMVHMVLADYSQNSLQAIFTGKNGVTDSPVFIDLGNWN